MNLRRIVEQSNIKVMKKIWMTTKDALRPATDAKHTPRHAAEHDQGQMRHVPYDHRMSDRFRPSLSTR